MLLAMANERQEEGAEASVLLSAWSIGDFDGFADELDSIVAPSRSIIEELDDRQGDARGLEDEIALEFNRLARITRGALYLARQSIDLVLDPPTQRRLAGREEVLQHLAHLEGPADTE